MVSETILSVLKTVPDYDTLEDEVWKIVSEQMRVTLVAVLEQIDEELSKSREKGLRFIAYRERSVTGFFGEIIEAVSERQEAKRLFLEADGVMVALQREAVRKGELKMGIANTGWERVHPASNRCRLTGKVAYCTSGDGQAFWEGFTTELRRHYELGGSNTWS